MMLTLCGVVDKLLLQPFLFLVSEFSLIATPEQMRRAYEKHQRLSWKFYPHFSITLG